VVLSDILTGGADTGLDTLDGDPSSAVVLSDTLTGGPDTVGVPVTAVLAVSDTPSDTSAVLTGGPDTGSDTLDGQRDWYDLLFGDLSTAGLTSGALHVTQTGASLWLSATSPLGDRFLRFVCDPRAPVEAIEP
jgi:hypothetical protein